jgi:hypothetical protein
MIERQRVLLSFVDRAGGAPPKTQVMQWLFLLREEQSEALGASTFYEFVPYEFGPFSFQADRDIAGFEGAGLLKAGELAVPADTRSRVRDEVRKLPRRATDGVEEILRAYGKVPREELLDDVYDRYPWYATRSELRKRKRRQPAAPAVYTVGYEGRTIDGLLDHLLRSGIERLIDVRRHRR